MMKPSRKAALAAVGGAAVLAALVGCSSSPGSDVSGKVTITIGDRPAASDADNRAYYDKQVAVFTRVWLLRSLVTQQEPPDHPLAAALDWHTEVRAERLRGYRVFVRRQRTIVVEHQPHILRV